MPYNTNGSPGYVSWNPNGRHNFSLDNCAVTGLVMDGASDPVQGTVSTSQVGVLVDLDTQQQLVSEIIGMKLTIAVGGGSVTGTFLTNNFVDINFARTSGNNPNCPRGSDGAAGAAYQSVLTDLQWNVATSNFLKALKSASPKMLSIRMNVDGHHGNFGDPLFTTGRVAGTIGPYVAGEPLTFTNARFLRPTTAAYGAGWNAVPAKYDEKRRKLVVDLGNATPWIWSKGEDEPAKSAVSSVQVATIAFTAPNMNILDTLPASVDTSAKAYQANAFVQELDVPKKIDVSATPLAIVSGGDIVITENPTGAYANAEPYVFRLNPGDTADVTLWANTFQQPAAKAEIPLVFNNTWLVNQQEGGPALATPASACAFPTSVTTDKNGKATFTIKAGDPKNPRGPIGGQVYGVGWSWDLDLIPDQWNFLSVKIFDTAKVPDQPTWWGDVYPILAQYAYLYPSMQAIINLNDYDAVVKNASEIIDRLTAPDDSPGQMPITRELSAAQRAIIVKWAKDPAHPPGGLPVPPPMP